MPKGDFGFHSMSREKLREIAARGGRRAHAMGVARKWTTLEARQAGRKGGLMSQQRKRQTTPTAPTTSTMVTTDKKNESVA